MVLQCSNAIRDRATGLVVGSFIGIRPTLLRNMYKINTNGSLGLLSRSKFLLYLCGTRNQFIEIPLDGLVT